MKLINLDEFVVFGQGSEWLWTMISGLVLAITFLAIARQLGLQRDAAAVEHVRTISREWTDERMSRAKFEALSGIRDGATPAATLSAGTDIGDFWEGLAYLVRMRNMDRKLVYNSLGPAARIWWGYLAPAAEVAREEANDRGIWVDFEWLAGIFATFDRKAGEPATYDAEYLARRLPDLLESNRRAIRTFEELRAVVIRPLSATARDPRPRTRRTGVAASTHAG
jgi:hypothetical protein